MRPKLDFERKGENENAQKKSFTTRLLFAYSRRA